MQVLVTPKVEIKSDTESKKSDKVEELQHKLDATEAQLLNIRTELAKMQR